MQYDLRPPGDPQREKDMRQLQSVRTLVVLWLLVVAVAIGLVPTVLISGWVHEDRLAMEDDFEVTQLMIASAAQPDAATLRLQEELSKTEVLIGAVQSVVVPMQGSKDEL